MKKVEVEVQLYCGHLIVEVQVPTEATETEILNAALAEITNDMRFAKLDSWRNI